MTTPRLCSFRVPWTTTAKRMAGVPSTRELFFDIDLRAMFYGDGITRGGVRIPIGRDWMNGRVGNIPVFAQYGRLQDSGRSIENLVIGPARSTNQHLALFDGGSGKRLTESYMAISDVVTGAGRSVDGNFPVFNGPAGNVLKDSGKSIGWLQTALNGKAGRPTILTSLLT